MTTVYPFPYQLQPMANITGMTYQDGTTYLRELAQLKAYINDSLVKDVNDVFADVAAQYQAGVTNAENAMLAFVANFTEEIKTINTGAVDGMVTTDGNPVRASITAMIDTEITAVTTALQSYTDGEVTTLRDEVEANVADLTAKAGVNGYLVATFTGNSADGETLSLFYSADGKTVTGGAGNPAYVPADGQGVRDPSLIRRNGKWFLAHTSNNGIDKDFHIAVSDSGAPGTWSQYATINGAGLPDVSRIWAPEFVVAPDGVYIFFSRVKASNTSQGTMFWVKATNDQLTGWTAPAALTWTSEPAHYIDGVPVQHTDGKWYLFSSTGNDIERATANTVTGPYTRDKVGNWAGWGTGIEGPYLSKEGDTYRMYFDRFAAGTGVAWSESTDLTAWTVPQPLIVAPGVLKAGQTIRHGSFYKLDEPQDGLQALAGQLRGAKSRHIELYAVPGVTVTNATATQLTGWTLDTNESTENDLVSWDGAGNITLKRAGVYSITPASNVTGVTGVVRAFTDFTNVDGPAVTHLRVSHGAEDKLGAPFPNFKTKAAGERVAIKQFVQWTGPETEATLPVRLRITLESSY